MNAFSSSLSYINLFMEKDKRNKITFPSFSRGWGDNNLLFRLVIKQVIINAENEAVLHLGSEWCFQSIAIKTLKLLLCLYKCRNEKNSNAGKLCLLIKELGLGILIRKNRATSTGLPWLALRCEVLVQLTKHLNFCIKQFWFNCAVLADFCCPLGDVCQSAIIGRDLRVNQVVILQQIYYFQELLPTVLGTH